MSDLESWDAARIERAVARYQRFVRIKSWVSILLAVGIVALGVLLMVTGHVLVGILVLLFGSPVAAVVIGPVLMLPIGYLVCGRDSMRLGALAVREHGSTR